MKSYLIICNGCKNKDEKTGRCKKYKCSIKDPLWDPEYLRCTQCLVKGGYTK